MNLQATLLIFSLMPFFVPTPQRGTSDAAVAHFEYPLTVWTKLMVLEENKFLLCRPAIPADSVKTDVVCFSLPRGAIVLIPKPGYKLAPPTHKAGD